MGFTAFSKFKTRWVLEGEEGKLTNFETSYLYDSTVTYWSLKDSVNLIIFPLWVVDAADSIFKD